MQLILIACGALIALGGITGFLLAFASLKLAVPINPRIAEVEAELPGANCGACGYPGCAGYAEAIVLNNLDLTLCKPGGPAVAKAVAALMGRTINTDTRRRIAFVYCQGGTRAIDRATYSGTTTCQKATLVGGGQKKCAYGCLGFGDCVETCQFDALHINKHGVPEVDQDKCINCGACIKACPKNLIRETLHKPVKRVVCASQDQGPAAKAACSIACIACGLCIKACPFQAIVMDNCLAVIDPEKCTNCGTCVTRCPTKAIL